MTQQELLRAALRYHDQNPGCWLRTDQGMTTIEDVIKDPKAEQPLDGKMWWRTHHLVRQLGGQA